MDKPAKRNKAPPAGSSLFGLFGFAETPEIAGSPVLTRVSGLFGLFGWKWQTTPRLRALRITPR